MKKLFIALICLLPVKAALAQKDLLSFDEHNKYIYYQVVEQPGLPADTLEARAMYFLKKAYPKTKITTSQIPADITGTDEFTVYSGIGLMKQEDGEIDYTLHIECKDQKYRYWLTDFIYRPYKIDRYGNSVPEMGVYIPLETASTKIDKKPLDSYLNQTGAFGNKLGHELKQYMINISAAPPAEIKKKVISTKDW
jgi:hypothetical protein